MPRLRMTVGRWWSKLDAKNWVVKLVIKLPDVLWALGHCDGPIDLLGRGGGLYGGVAYCTENY